MKRLLGVVLVALAAAPAAAAGPYGVTDHVVTMDDGVGIAATLYTPEQPAGASPAVMLFHGLGGSRQSVAPIAQIFADEGYVTLTFDFRGHGQSGGLFTGLGPRELADIAILRESWLPGAAPITDRVGGWGISLGGGALLRAVGEGTPFAAIQVVETWTDLYDALVPQGFPKTGAIFQFLGAVPRDRQAPELLAIGESVSRRDLPALRAFSQARSSRHLLERGYPPTLFFQGRRDFAFGLEQGLSAFQRLNAPKALYIGPFGHAPSRFPGPDFERMRERSLQWFASLLRGLPTPDLQPIELAPDPFRGQTVGYARLPATRTLRWTLPGSRTIGSAGKVVRRVRLPAGAETFGAPVVRLRASSTSNWSHLVAVLAARTRSGQQIVVSQGAAPVRLTRAPRLVSIRLISQVTTIPRGSTLELTIAGTSTAQHPANLLYLMPVPQRARVTIGRADLHLPVLQTPVSSR